MNLTFDLRNTTWEPSDGSPYLTGINGLDLADGRNLLNYAGCTFEDSDGEPGCSGLHGGYFDMRGSAPPLLVGTTAADLENRTQVNVTFVYLTETEAIPYSIEEVDEATSSEPCVRLSYEGPDIANLSVFPVHSPFPIRFAYEPFRNATLCGTEPLPRTIEFGYIGTFQRETLQRDQDAPDLDWAPPSSEPTSDLQRSDVNRGLLDTIPPHGSPPDSPLPHEEDGYVFSTREAFQEAQEMNTGFAEYLASNNDSVLRASWITGTSSNIGVGASMGPVDAVVWAERTWTREMQFGVPGGDEVYHVEIRKKTLVPNSGDEMRTSYWVRHSEVHDSSRVPTGANFTGDHVVVDDARRIAEDIADEDFKNVFVRAAKEASLGVSVNGSYRYVVNFPFSGGGDSIGFTGYIALDSRSGQIRAFLAPEHVTREFVPQPLLDE